ncbi:hypothetical protein CsSME_00043047 [Camellia sinensis var. sinensis]
MAEIAVNLLAKNLKELLSSKIDLILEEKDQIQILYEDLQLLRANLNDLQVKFFDQEQVKNLEARIRDLAYEADNTIDSFLVNILSRKNTIDWSIDWDLPTLEEIMMDDLEEEIKKDRSLKPEIQHDHSLNLEHVKEEIEAIKTEMMGIYDIGLEAILQVGSCSSSGGSDSSNTNTNTNTKTWGVGEEEIMVGFEDEAMSLKEQLTGGPKELQVISIVGMAGQGKTTLATKLYNDPLVVYYFYIRAWTSVSQEYRKRDLLTRLLSCVMKHTNGIDQMGDEKLCVKLYQSLKGQRYFIVMDDIWDTKAWVDLKNYFPNDKNGSRIMFTSRHEEVALQAKPNSPTLSLRFLTHNESWDLFQHKVFGKRENCPVQLMEIGKQIVKKCHGLPLAIVVVAGIFTNEDNSPGRWKQVGETLNSNLAVDPQLWMKTLALSYNHLPHHLKLCFLYFGTFPEDYEIRVQKLIRLWIAEGFIIKTSEKSLEDVGNEYLMDLLSRNLLLVSRRGYDGEIKACGIHDLLREFCIKQGTEEFFLQRISGYQRISGSITSGLRPRSLLCFNSGCAGSWYPRFLSLSFKLLKVLDISCIQIFKYPSEVELLVLLRYLALEIHFNKYPGTSWGQESTLNFLPPSISKLVNLETFILSTSCPLVKLPDSLCNMVNLRHLCVSGGGKYNIEESNSSLSFVNLRTLSWLELNQYDSYCFVNIPNLKKLGLCGRMLRGKSLMFPDLHVLKHLQELKLWNTGIFTWGAHILERTKLPPTLRKLTLKKTCLKWDEMSTLGKSLPKLEGLKLLYRACRGKRWETSDGEFPQLKFLKLRSVEFDQWEVSRNHFPKLQRLVLIQCNGLKKIPYEMGDIPTLQMIEVHWCHPSLANSAKEIKDKQKRMGNNWLQMIESNNDVL